LQHPAIFGLCRSVAKGIPNVSRTGPSDLAHAKITAPVAAVGDRNGKVVCVTRCGLIDLVYQSLRGSIHNGLRYFCHGFLFIWAGLDQGNLQVYPYAKPSCVWRSFPNHHPTTFVKKCLTIKEKGDYKSPIRLKKFVEIKVFIKTLNTEPNGQAGMYHAHLIFFNRIVALIDYLGKLDLSKAELCSYLFYV
jgi:hypothetical protein